MSPTRRQFGGVRGRLMATACASGLLVGAGSAEMRVAGSDAPITLEPVERMTEHGPIRGWAATIDLSDPAIDVVVSDIDGDADLDDADVEIVEGAEVILTPMDSFVTRTGVHLAFNANFFSWKEDAEGNKTQADIIGLSVSDGRIYSERREATDPVLILSKAKHGFRGDTERTSARVDALRSDSDFPVASAVGDGEAEYWKIDVVAGIGPSGTSDVPGTLLVQDGENLGETARVAPTKRHPRTAAGVSEDGTMLYVLVIDGRQIGHSIGATLPEMADLLIEMGADDAVALDGGGSSSIIGRARLMPEHLRALADPDGDGWVTNRPSDGRYRPIANQVGIRWAEAGEYEGPPAFIPGTADVWSEGAGAISGGASVGSEGPGGSTGSKQESP
ncbi:MAG: phosphodiester glycosidase family protein [Planctomycetota bacterium]